MLSRLFVLLQYLLPKYLMTALVHRVARIRVRVVKNALIRGFMALYDVNTEEVRVITSYSIHYTKLYESRDRMMPPSPLVMFFVAWKEKHAMSPNEFHYRNNFV